MGKIKQILIDTEFEDVTVLELEQQGEVQKLIIKELDK